MEANVSNEIRSGANIVSGKDYEELILSVTGLAVEAVSSTLGPYGSTTIIEDGSFTYPTKDGWSILARLRFGDPIENSIYNMIKLISFNLVNLVGDGTTSAVIGAYYFMQEMFKVKEQIAKSKMQFRQIDFKNAIDKIKNIIIKELRESDQVHEINKDDPMYTDIYNVAYISSNGDKSVSDMIRHIYMLTNNPNILVSIGSESATTFETETGYRYDCKPINQKIYRNRDDDTCLKENQTTYVAIFDHNLTFAEHGSLIGGLSNYMSSINGEIIIMAPYFDEILSEIIGTQIERLIKNGSIPNIILVQCPISMEVQKAYLTDVAIIAKAQVFNTAKVKAFNIMVHNQTHPDDPIDNPMAGVDGYDFESPTDLIKTCLGTTRNVTIAENYLLFRDFDKDSIAYQTRSEEIAELYESAKKRSNASNSTLNREYMAAKQHYVRFSGNMGIIKVGGDSDSEKHFRKDAIDDAVLACKSAYENGYVKGMNLSILTVLYRIKNNSMMDKYSSMVVDILYNTFFKLAETVICNKYNIDDTIEVHDKSGKLHKSKYIISADVGDSDKATVTIQNLITFAAEYNMGFNLVTNTVESPEELTVINSVSTDIETLKAILSILSLVLTSTQLISTNRIIDKRLTEKERYEKMLRETADVATVKANIYESLIKKILEIPDVGKNFCAFLNIEHLMKHSVPVNFEDDDKKGPGDYTII